MTTIEEQLSLMDWSRANDGIGVGCADQDDTGVCRRRPECCEDEREEYLQLFEVGLRATGSAGERAYFTIRQAAKNAWRRVHAEDYEGPVMQARVRAWLDAGRYLT